MYKESTLPNGLRIITHEIQQRDSISLGFWVGVGGRYEEDRIKGAAHFLEHIVFKGSKKYSCEQIKEKIEGVGGALNAFTSEEQTCFYAKIPAKHLTQTFDVLADMILYPKITPSDTTKEKTVIIEEIKMYHDLPQYYVLELLDELMWPGHPLGRGLAGTHQSVGNMTVKDLKKFHRDNYVPGNIVVAASGRLSHQAVLNLTKKKFKGFEGDHRGSFIPAEHLQAKPRMRFFKKDIEQMHVALGMPGLDEKHKDKYALSLLTTILGGNMSSRLFVEVREKKGLAYSIGCSAKSLHDTGAVLIRAGVDNKKIIQAMQLILKELAKIKKNGVGQREFERARDYLLGQLLLGLEDTMEHMLWIGDSLISRDKVKTLKHVVKEFKKIKKEDMKRVAKDILDPKQFNLALVGPITNQQEKELQSLFDN